MSLSRYEMETHVNFNDYDKIATIYTCNKSMMNKMDRYCLSHPDTFKLISQDEESKTYEFPKKLFSIRKPSKKKEYTPEQMESLKEQGRKLSMLKSKINT